jgi:hypothetical protein
MNSRFRLHYGADSGTPHWIREWEAQRAEHDRSRDRPRRGQPFHEFHVWLSQYVNELVAGSHDVPADVQLLAHPPSPRVLQYRSLWAYGNHIRVEAEGGNAHVTYDCGAV